MFSVLLPTRNGGEFLDGCIRSILAESYQNMELLVSDNANTDQTQQVLACYRPDKRLRVIRLDKPVCVTDNWNAALAASSGKYVLMMGDDDCLLPGYFLKMEKLIRKYNEPDCLTYNAYSFVAPNSVHNTGCFYKDPFFSYGAEFSQESNLSCEKRFAIVRDMFRFRNRIPLNMQTTLMKRAAMDTIKGGAFQPPFPDHYALNSLLLTAGSWVFSPEKMLVVGVSPKSFGHFIYSNKQDEGRRYLGIDSGFKGRLPGSELNNCMYTWLSMLKTNFPEQLKKIRISRSCYVRRQVYSWYLQYRSDAATLADIQKWLGLLSLADWFYAATFLVERQSWQRLWRMLTKLNRSSVQTHWQGALPLENISTIVEFAAWVGNNAKERRL